MLQFDTLWFVDEMSLISFFALSLLGRTYSINRQEIRLLEKRTEKSKYKWTKVL